MFICLLTQTNIGLAYLDLTIFSTPAQDRKENNREQTGAPGIYLEWQTKFSNRKKSRAREQSALKKSRAKPDRVGGTKR